MDDSMMHQLGHFMGLPHMFWEESMYSTIEKILEMSDFFDDTINYHKVMTINLTPVGAPDFRTIARNLRMTEEEVVYIWERFRINMGYRFGDDLKREYSWISDGSTGARNDEIMVQTQFKNLRDTLHSKCQHYRFAKQRLWFPLPDEEIEMIKLYFENERTFDFFGTEPDTIKKLEPKRLEKELEDYLKYLIAVKKDIEVIDLKAESLRETMVSDFNKNQIDGKNN